jgi:hypothetical protein
MMMMMMQDSQDPILLLKIPIGTQKKIFKIIDNLDTRFQKRSPSLVYTLYLLSCLGVNIENSAYKCCYTILILVLS